MIVPASFESRMKDLLQDEYEAFRRSYEQPRAQALRVNTLKLSAEDFLAVQPFRLEPVPWAPAGFYYDGEEDRPGRHPWHEAGLYYIQEPSAMAVAELAAPQPGERVLDLCAAPGGKTTHLAQLMRGEGLLVANEPHPARAKILSQNVERMGVPHAVVTSELPDRLSPRFPAFFDRIVVDAPCSGEGMFRKDPDACAQWSPDHVRLCAARQEDILRHAALMLRPGGTLVYSTCTFAPEENEGAISRFLREHPEFSVAAAQRQDGFGSGRPDWTADPAPGLEHTVRIWPHRTRGEGHYAAVLRKAEEAPAGGAKLKLETGLRRDKLPEPFLRFAEESLAEQPQGRMLLFGDQLYALPEGMPELAGLKVLRPGLHLGTLKKNRFEPSHALALALRPSQARHAADLPLGSAELAAYLRGEAIAGGGAKGWQLVLASGYPIGWGKLADGQLKNHFPKGLRWTGVPAK
ncbi:tRNA/RNA cytosine-C5-methylase [Paenibacillus pasadenensis]|uniref:tRNA/RNA cytosine-C5-methylase n=1 Tax=Paenibacillus pasadenensis TaxID=217090 RepID=A0A2N5NB33_9BACL|nr:RsmF rRNA methyltransferase first C-terminal domain-containing protein [Paenibacillus pasadenensis]PLT47561.1 tRNA/RNA cytosine-C5-methylase [Paenibacillus pasadenensis]